MKHLVLLSAAILAGCATTTPPVQAPKVLAPHEIMQDCGAYQRPTTGTFEEVVELLVKNKGIYDECKKQNKAKKDFIIRQERN